MSDRPIRPASLVTLREQARHCTACGLLATARAPHAIATVHPSAVLRSPDGAQREHNYRDFVADLRVARQAVAATAPRGPTSATP